MSPESGASQKIAAALAYRVGSLVDRSQVASAIISMFEDINAALTPIIGPKGVAALYRRSLFLCMSTHPIYADRYKGLAVAMNLTEFRSILSEQEKTDAVCFSEQLLKTFYELLATLIGRSLAARLLLDVWGNFLSGSVSQDTPQ
ncbi:hypothetical protein [Pseudomonas rhizosphaerae]|jgi:hypothetical protein|uniref:hypothetical protein n=1 Tax=Pseudomonas rhizosphaerae TaxID=216142 RepID=UPI001ED9B0E0|nr:hypothetical protein [Pseudomonas rhizosphaerae]